MTEIGQIILELRPMSVESGALLVAIGRRLPQIGPTFPDSGPHLPKLVDISCTRGPISTEFDPGFGSVSVKLDPNSAESLCVRGVARGDLYTMSIMGIFRAQPADRSAGIWSEHVCLGPDPTLWTIAGTKRVSSKSEPCSHVRAKYRLVQMRAGRGRSP